LGDFAATPLYNIKAVVQATGISPSTLRAWERRYNIAQPHRSESGYRLYSERDIAVIRWLKAQVEAGMSISQAVSWLGNITTEAGDTAHTVLPTASSSIPQHESLAALPTFHREPHREEVHDLTTLQHELISALTHFDEEAAEEVIAEAFAVYPFEQVGDKLFMPVLQELDEWRQRGDLTVTAQHYASNYLLHRLGTLLRATPNHHTGPLIWVGCACAEAPDAGALLLSIYLRRSGYQVHYLGHNLPVEERAVQDLIHEVRRHQPAMLIFSATTALAAERVGQLSSRLTQYKHLPAIVAYSGAVYTHSPELRAVTAGVYIGAENKEAVQNINELLAERQHSDRQNTKPEDRQLGNGKPLTTKTGNQQATRIAASTG
jgi:DNA-binding transcriptional MerR regulator